MTAKGVSKKVFFIIFFISRKGCYTKNLSHETSKLVIKSRPYILGIGSRSAILEQFTN